MSVWLPSLAPLTRVSCLPASPFSRLQVLPQAISLVKSPLLQGSALAALQAFFQALVGSGASGASAEGLLAQLSAAGTGALARLSLSDVYLHGWMCSAVSSWT